MTEIQKLVKDALRVGDLPLNVQECFMTLIIQQAVTIGHLHAAAALHARMSGADVQPVMSDEDFSRAAARDSRGAL